MNEKKVICISIIVSFLIGCLFTGAISCGYYFYKSGLNRVEYRELTEELEFCNSEIGRIKQDLGDCQSTVADSVSDIAKIGNAVEAIREQTKILQRYYNRINDIYSSIDDSHNNNGKED